MHLNHGDLLQTVYLGKKSEAQPACQILLLNNIPLLTTLAASLAECTCSPCWRSWTEGGPPCPSGCGALCGNALDLAWREDLACLWEAACELCCPAS